MVLEGDCFRYRQVRSLSNKFPDDIFFTPCGNTDAATTCLAFYYNYLIYVHQVSGPSVAYLIFREFISNYVFYVASLFVAHCSRSLDG